MHAFFSASSLLAGYLSCPASSPALTVSLFSRAHVHSILGHIKFASKEARCLFLALLFHLS